MNGTNSDEIKLLPSNRDNHPKRQLTLLVVCLLISNTSLYWWMSPEAPSLVVVEESNVLVQVPASKMLLGPASGQKMPISITNGRNQLLVSRGYLHPSGETGMDIVEIPKEKVSVVLQQKNSLIIIPHGTYQAKKTTSKENIHEIIF